VDNGAVTNDFGYNARSEVNSALMGTNTYGYVFDPIGNRIVATNNAVATAYLANELNQYTNILRVSAPPREDTPTHDADGNLLSNGAWSFAWDGENRLLSASNATTLVTYVHDFQSRRVGRKQYTWETDHWSLITDHSFLYDGWALIRETIQHPQSAITNHFVYGLDISGAPQGAGTIGGIISANLDGTTVFYGYDGNGNVTDLVDTNGVVAEHYEYSPFGETIAQFRNPAFTQSQPFRFSTKRQDEATGLLHYGYRDLDVVWGRWSSRDPIEERRGVNLSGFVGNSGLGRVDALGQIEFNIGIGLGISGTVFVPYPATWGGSLWGHGLGVSYTAFLAVGVDTTRTSDKVQCAICHSGGVTILSGVGVGGAIGVSAPVVTFGPSGDLNDLSGFAISVGMGIAIPPGPPVVGGKEVTVEVDIKTKQVWLTVPKWNPGLGVLGYAAIRITGSCTGCTGVFGSPTVRNTKLSTCLGNVMSAIGGAFKKASAMTFPQDVGGQVLYVHPEDISVDSCGNGE
jgi:RHS repeat-associated protein